VQPTVPSRSVSVVSISYQERAPSDEQRNRQGLVTQLMKTDYSMRLIHRISTLLAALGALVSLALAGGAGVQGW
jgi:hypothetical protein